MKTMIRILALLVVSTAWRLDAQVVRTWVATTGLDTNPCTRSEPCRNFNAAIAAVDPDGEVVVLESGGYGAVHFDKPAAIISPSGIHAAIAPTGGDAVSIDSALTTGAVVLRGLYLNSQGAATGLRADGAFVIHVESCVIHGFNTGIVMAGSSPRLLFVNDSVIRNSSKGIVVQAVSAAAGAVIERSRIETGDTGVFGGEHSKITLRDSVLSLNQLAGVIAFADLPGTAAKISLENCMVVGTGNEGSSIGIDVQSGVGNSVVQVSRTTVTGCDSGIQIGATELLVLTESTITHNGFGVQSAGTFETRQNNSIFGNVIDLAGASTPVPGI